MIDAESLKRLGWSDELIAEVVRSADHLRTAFPTIAEINQAPVSAELISATEMYFDPQTAPSSTSGIVVKSNG